MSIKITTREDIFDGNKKVFDKPEYLNYDIGFHNVRILGDLQPTFVHSFFRKNGGTVKCLGSECPICQNNKSIRDSYPDDYRQQPGYYAASLRHYANVYDRTNIKVCPKCGAENKADLTEIFPAKCKSCGTFINEVEPTPSNKVKIANISDTNATYLVNIQNSVLGEDKEPLGLENFDVKFTVMMAGSRKTILPSEGKNKDKLELDVKLYDLSKAVIELSPEELQMFANGVSLRDIFLARKNENSYDAKAESVLEEVEASVAELFGA
jgi:hypothetical protein